MPSPRRAGRSRKSRHAAAPRLGDLALGIDLGATKVISALVDPAGHIVRESGRHLHANDGPGGVIATVVRSARACLEPEGEMPRAVGIAVAAQVDPRTGTVVHAPNLGWRDVPLARRLADDLGGKVSVVNDARAATFAEWQFGAGIGEANLFCLFLGTGVGGSAVFDGRLIEGGTHAAGEVGHITIVSGGRRCHCPNWGCFEAYVGGRAIGERAREAVQADPNAGARLVGRAGSEEAITAQTLFQEYRTGDPLSRRLVRETERYLTDGAVSVVNAFNPNLLILGGGLIAGMPEFVPAVEAAVRARCQPPAAFARVVRARFAEAAPMIGAAALARGQLLVPAAASASARARGR
jgi:glucokinase